MIELMGPFDHGQILDSLFCVLMLLFVPALVQFKGDLLWLTKLNWFVINVTIERADAVSGNRVVW